MVDRLGFFAASITRKLFPRRPDCIFSSLYRPHLPNNEELWQVFSDDESICVFIQNEPYNLKEIISLKNNKIPKGLTPLESLFSTSDVSNNKYFNEE
jgi:hypothetical protein